MHTVGICPFAEGWCNCIEGAGSPAAPALLAPSHFIVLSICTTASSPINNDQIRGTLAMKVSSHRTGVWS